MERQGFVNNAQYFWEVKVNKDGKKPLGLSNKEVIGDIRGKFECSGGGHS